jgi:hypothetical protein
MSLLHRAATSQTAAYTILAALRRAPPASAKLDAPPLGGQVRPELNDGPSLPGFFAMTNDHLERAAEECSSTSLHASCCLGFPPSAVRGRVLAATADGAEIADQPVGEPDVSHLMATACFLVR